MGNDFLSLLPSTFSEMQANTQTRNDEGVARGEFFYASCILLGSVA
jgi:hypothetical protein